MASFTCDIQPYDYNWAVLNASFSGGDPDYLRKRFIKLVLTGSSTRTIYIDSIETGGASSNFYEDIESLTASTHYTWTATLGYYDGSNNRQLTTYTDSGSFTTPARTYTLKLKITYDANGGSGAPAATTYTYPDETSSSAQKTVTLSSTVPTRSGYRFSGWLLNGTVYAAGASVRLTATTSTAQYTAVAQWTESGFFIWNGSAWKPATPYIWNGSAWKPAGPYIYSNGWHPQ